MAVKRSRGSRSPAGCGVLLAMICTAWACGSSGTGGDDDDDVAAVDGAPGAPDAPAVDPTAFLIDRFELRDPHIFFDLLGCTDVTDSIAGGDGLNDILQETITTDGDGDGLLDLSMLLVFQPLDQDGAGGAMVSGTVECTAPLASTTCQSVAPLDPTTYVNTHSGACPGPFAGTTSSAGYTPSVSVPSSPCFATDPWDMAFDFSGYLATLAASQSTAAYVGDPANGLANGNFRAFLSEADAAAIILPIEGVGDVPLIDLLPGSATSCALHDDRDTGPDGVTRGWWFYFDLSARKVPYIAAAASR